jgi:hypothetical protein
MQYMFLLYSDSLNQSLAPEEMARRMERHLSIMSDANARGVLRGCSPLQPVSTAVTVRPANGKLRVSDGPFAETKEALGGFYLIDCNNPDEAKYWAGRLAGTGCATAVEFRALLDMPEPMQQAARQAEPAVANA